MPVTYGGPSPEDVLRDVKAFLATNEVTERERAALHRALESSLDWSYAEAGKGYRIMVASSVMGRALQSAFEMFLEIREQRRNAPREPGKDEL